MEQKNWKSGRRLYEPCRGRLIKSQILTPFIYISIYLGLVILAISVLLVSGCTADSFAETAGIDKQVYPYLFRHSRGTELYKQIGEAMAKKYMGHAPDSNMARVYLHLNDQDILESMLQNYGMKPEEEKKDDRNICGACGHPNSYVAEVCSVCRSPLKDPDVAKAINFEEQVVSSAEYEQIAGIKELLENPNVLKVLREAANRKGKCFK